MIISEREVQKVRNVLIVAEQGSQTMKYGSVYIMNDGPNKVKQITLSIGFTQYGGNLGKVLKEYSERGGEYSDTLGPYCERMNNASTVNDKGFVSTLKKAGEDPIMQRVQEEMFDKLYLGRGIEWGEDEGFELPLSYLCICDSFLHSGSILGFLRNKFGEVTPKNGGGEKDWISAYMNVRHEWLRGHSNELLVTSSYRTEYYLKLITIGDWALEDYHELAMNGTYPLQVV